MKKLLLSIFLILGITMLLGFVSAETFHIDDSFKVGWTDGTNNYEATYKVWKIEEINGKNVTTLIGLPWGGIAISQKGEGEWHALGANGKIHFDKVYVSGDDKYISISLENAQFKEDDTTTTPPSSGGGGGGGTTNDIGGGGQGGGCYDADGGKNLYKKGIAAGVYDSCISKYQLSERYCTNSQGADYIVDCPIGYLCSDGACAQSSEDDRQENTTTTPTTTYFKTCTYVWDSSPYVNQAVKITASINDSKGAKDSDSVDVRVLNQVSGGGGGAGAMDGKTLQIQITEPASGDVGAGAVSIKISSKGPNELGDMSLSLTGDSWGAGFPISNKNCVSGGTGGGGSGSGGSSGTSTSCEKYYRCPDGQDVQYCQLVKQYDTNGNLISVGCGCKTNPAELCTAPNSGGGGGGGASQSNVTSIPSSGGGGGSGNNETPIICNGCILGDKCVPIGFRNEGKYCDLSSELKEQNKANSVCENNFECDSNLCIDNKCVSGSVWAKFMRWFNRLFGGK